MFMSASSSSSGSTSISFALARALRFFADGRAFFFGLVSVVGFRPEMWSTISTDDCLSAAHRVCSAHLIPRLNLRLVLHEQTEVSPILLSRFHGSLILLPSLSLHGFFSI